MDSDQSDADLLRTQLGPTLFAALGGDRGDGAGERLGVRVWAELTNGGIDADLARAWIIGANPLLDDDTPVTAIREGRTAAVLGAVRALTHADGDPEADRERILAQARADAEALRTNPVYLAEVSAIEAELGGIPFVAPTLVGDVDDPHLDLDALIDAALAGELVGLTRGGVLRAWLTPIQPQDEADRPDPFAEVRAEDPQAPGGDR